MRIVRKLSPGLFLVANYLQLRGKTYYYVRQIPEPLRERFGGKVCNRKSLRTSDPEKAALEASKLARADDALWEAMRANHALPVPEVRKAANALIDEYKPTEWKEPHPFRPGEFAIWSKSEVLTTLLETDGNPLLGTEVY
jgi:hypothetical protein